MSDKVPEKIMIVDDEKNIVDIVVFNLKKDGYTAISACDGEQGYELFQTEKPDLILLDIMMPKMDGYTMCRKVRETSNVPIIMLTARADEVDKVLGLDLGADDYMTKPFSIRELLSRVRANLRRVSMSSTADSAFDGNIITYKELSIDVDRYEVKKNGVPIELTVREFELIKFLAMNKGQIFSREALLEKVWDYEYYGDVRTVDVTVHRIREKLERDTSNAEYIVTKRGIGYMIAKD